MGQLDKAYLFKYWDQDTVFLGIHTPIHIISTYHTIITSSDHTIETTNTVANTISYLETKTVTVAFVTGGKFPTRPRSV